MTNELEIPKKRGDREDWSSDGRTPIQPDPEPAPQITKTACKDCKRGKLRAYKKDQSKR